MGYHHSAEHANFRPCDVSLTQKFSICDQLWISSQHIFYIYIVSLQVFKPFLTIHIKMIHTQSLSPTASLHYHMFFEALFDIDFHCSAFYIGITNQYKWTNYLIHGRWQTDGSIPRELVDGVTAQRRFLFVCCVNKRTSVIFDT